MDATTIAPFLIFQVFFGLTSHQYVISSKAAPEDLSRAEIMLWRENTALATVMTTALLVARVNGICFLLYLGYRTEWMNAFILFVAGLLTSLVVGALIRLVAGTLLPALIGYVVMPIAGTLMWFIIP